ncbi:MAG TPA: PEFG-CTERM sorting domain-containing protein [Nitrosopumilaceae archaeon]|nr:PEFG-CTERM sorting domain-containing protein [Nitrosopumilaceae archaeon]
MILTARIALVLSAVLVLGLANYMTTNESNITDFILGSAFAQTDATGAGNPSDPNAIPQNNSTDPNAISQYNYTDSSAMPQDNSSNPYAMPQDNSSNPFATIQDNSTVTSTQNQASTPEFGPVSVLVLTIGLISIILVSIRSKFSWNIK